MSTKRTRESAPEADVDDTAELLQLREDGRPVEPEGAEGRDAWSSTDSWKLGPESQRELDREAELGTLRSDLALMAESRGQLENSLRSLAMNLRDLEERLVIKSSLTSAVERDLRAREAQVDELQQQLESLHAARHTDVQARQSMLAEHQARVAELERVQQAAHDSAHQREQELQATLATHADQLARSRQEHAAGQERFALLETSHLELQARHEASVAATTEMQRELQDRLDTVHVLTDQLEQMRQAHERSLTDLHIAEERIRADEIERRSRESRMEKLAASEASLRAESQALAQQLADRDALNKRLEHEAASSVAVLGKIQSNLALQERDDSALPKDLVARLLVRVEGGTEIVQVLGRRTLIGRGIDCQLQIDAEFISRRHALLLVSPEETIIEDLNSTNGVYVNGTRISRYRLAEGDAVTIGKTQFRYLLKSVADRG